jgi:hypothetical protein
MFMPIDLFTTQS